MMMNDEISQDHAKDFGKIKYNHAAIHQLGRCRVLRDVRNINQQKVINVVKVDNDDTSAMQAARFHRRIRSQLQRRESDMKVVTKELRTANKCEIFDQNVQMLDMMFSL